MLSYQWQGMEEAQRRLGALSSLAGFDTELEQGADTIVTALAEEPAERPGQRYIRTHKLSGGWRRSDARRDSRSILVDVTNATAYAPFVQGEDQAEMHRGRWKKLKVVGEEKVGVIRARAGAWAIRTWRGG